MLSKSEIQPCDLYIYCCQRHAIPPNSKIFEELQSKCCNGASCGVKHEFDFASNYVGYKGILPLLDTIQYYKELYKVNFSNNRLQHAEITEFAKRICTHPSLCSLNLSHNQLNDSCTNDLVKLIRSNKALTEIELTGNDFCSFSLNKIEAELVANKLNTVKANYHFTINNNVDHIDSMNQQDGVLTSEQTCLSKLENTKATKQETSKVKDLSTSAILQKYVNYPISFIQHSAEVNDYMSEEESGGCLQYSSWRSNHQYVLTINHKSTIKVEMRMHQTSLARVAGFTVMRSKGIHRIIDLSSTTVIAESKMSNTECDVVLEFEAGRYIIVPYTFYPSRSLSFTLSATLVNLPLTNVPHHTLQQETLSSLRLTCEQQSVWITLERLNKDYDWCSYTFTGAWNNTLTEKREVQRYTNEASLNVRDSTNQNNQFTWLHNDMYFVQCKVRHSTLSIQKYNELPMSLYVVLTKSNDSDDNDERCIGVDVIRPVTPTQTLPPLEPHTETTVLSIACARQTEICFKLDIHSLQQGVFIVPTSSTEVNVRENTYTLTLYSSLPLEVTPSLFPHGWHYTEIDGCWTAQSCGGCREINGSWKNNPTIEVNMAELENSAAHNASNGIDEKKTSIQARNNPATTIKNNSKTSDNNNTNDDDNKKKSHLIEPSINNIFMAVLEVDCADYTTETNSTWMQEELLNTNKTSTKNYAYCKYDTQTDLQQESYNNTALCKVKENMKREYANVNDTFFGDIEMIDKNAVLTEKYLRPSLIAISTIPPMYRCIESTNEPLLTSLTATTTPTSSSTESLVKSRKCEYAYLTIRDVTKSFYLMPFTRQPGMMARYKLHIFASCSFSVGNDESLALRERSAILRSPGKIESECDNCTCTLATKDITINTSSSSSNTNHSQFDARHTSERTNQVMYGETVKCNTKDNRKMEHKNVIYSDIYFIPHLQEVNQLFHDRSFPNASSSIWLDPLTQPLEKTLEINNAYMISNMNDNNTMSSNSNTNITSAGITRRVFPHVYTWKRISERFNEATVTFLGKNTCSPPVLQNDRSWFASALYAVASKPSWLHRLCVLYEPDSGKAVFQFYKEHAWRDVVVDDYLLFDAANQFIMGYSVNENDVFYPLIEKAYAKLHRCYETLERKVAMHSTLLHDFAYALTDLTGGVVDVIDMQKVIPRANAMVEQTSAQHYNNTHDAPIKSDKNRSAMHELCVQSCSIPPPPHSNPVYHEALNVCNMMSNCVQTTTCLWRRLCEAMRPDTLICAVRSNTASSMCHDGHACVGLLANQLYAIVDAQFAYSHRLLLLRNWCDGVHTHWTGQWSDMDNDNNKKCKWTDELKSMVHYDEESVKSGMTFWMSFDELLHYFTHLFITRVPRYTHTVDGILTCFVSNEPSLNSFYKFVTEHNFPQYALTIDLPTETCSQGEYQCKDTCTIASTSCKSIPKSNNIDVDGENESESVDNFISQVIIGIHQADVRMSLTRTADATVQPVGQLGLIVLEVENNTQRLSGAISISTNDNIRVNSCVNNELENGKSNINEKSVKLVGYIEPNITRNRYCALSIISNTLCKGEMYSNDNDGDNSNSNNKCNSLLKPQLTPQDKTHKNYILVPFSVQDKYSAIKQHPFQLTIQSSNQYLIDLHEITPDNRCTSIHGEWNALNNGGPPTSLLWRDNPQFVLYPRECARFKLELVIENNNATNFAEACEFGFTVHDSRTSVSLLDYDANSVIASGATGHNPHLATSSMSKNNNTINNMDGVTEENDSNNKIVVAAVVITLNGIQERKGAPYVVVPYCTNRNYIGSFTLRATSNVDSKWNSVHDICDKIYRLHKTLSIGQEYHSNLQHIHFNSWRCHPQFTLRLPYGTDGVIRVVAIAHKSTQNSSFSNSNNNNKSGDMNTKEYNGKLAIKQIIMKHKQENVLVQNTFDNNMDKNTKTQDKPCRVGCVLLRLNCSHNGNNNNNKLQNLHLYRQLCSAAFNEVVKEETSELGEVQLCVDLAKVEQSARQASEKNAKKLMEEHQLNSHCFTGNTNSKYHFDHDGRTSNNGSSHLTINNNIYTLIPYVDVKANAETVMDLFVYGSIPVELTPVKEWPFVKVMYGSWELGVNSGGCREWNASWVNNPFYGIATVRSTNVVITLVIYPRTAHTQKVTKAMKQCNSAEMTFPTIFAKNENNNIITRNSSVLAIQLDLFSNDALMTPLCHASSSSETASEEVTLSAHLTACDENPFIVVPCTLESEQDADFKLFVYADQPVDLYKIDKPRVAYAQRDRSNV